MCISFTHIKKNPRLHEVKQFYIENNIFTSLCFVEVSLSLSKFIVMPRRVSSSRTIVQFGSCGKNKKE